MSMPDVFTRASEFSDWVDQQLNGGGGGSGGSENPGAGEASSETTPTASDSPASYRRLRFH